MNTDVEKEIEPFDWEEWPKRRAEMLAAMKAMQQKIAALDPRPELDSVRAATDKFMRDMQNVISAGDAEYGRLHPGACFDSN
jgi:hypothetical protein